jgi:hypothetical protein
MNEKHNEIRACGRRRFLSQLSAAAAASGLAWAGRSAAEGAEPAAAEPLPTIELGKHRVTRLIVGSNPINGYSYLGPHMDRHMKEYYTPERTIELLQNCERAGINTHQFSAPDRTSEVLRALRDRGSKMHFICLHADRPGVKATVEATRPIAMVHHGGVTDRLFHDGKSSEVHDYVKAAHDCGVLAGVSAHDPDSIQKIADEGWEVDFFMTCFYFLTRKKLPPQDTLQVSYPFFAADPAAMTRVVRQVKQPCLGFKILAAGRKCGSQDTVKGAFRFAFENIKPSDGVIVGMYPRFFDEVHANAQYARQFGTRS